MLDFQVTPQYAPPHSRDAEEAVLGSVFINPDCFYEVARLLKSEDFYIVRNGWVWDAICKLANNHIAIDMLTVQNELAKRDVLAEVGGFAYLTGLINASPSSLNVVEYAGIVREQAERRAGIRLANQIVQKAYDDGQDFDLAQEALSIVTASRHDTRRMTTSDAASEMIDLMESPRYFTTGISDVDAKIGGLFPEELSVLAGKQGTGKSAAKIQGARKNADNGAKVLLIDLEMSAAQTWFRVSCGDLEVDVNTVRSGKASPELRGRLIDYAASLAEQYKNKIVIYQAPMTPADILSAAMMEQPDIIYVDTLKNLAGKPSKESPQGWYDFALNFLRINVAQKTKAHVQVLHHINRSAFKESRKPSMNDLMFAGESDADSIFLLHRAPESYEIIPQSGIVPITWITDKSRFGWTGEEEINFKLTKQEFFGMSRR